MRQYPADHIYNVGIFSHGGAGRTTLVEAMLFDTGAINRRGRVSMGTTVSDSDPEEVKRHFTLTNSVIPIEYNDCKINVIDTPDYSDFGGDVRSAMRVVDAAIIVIDAASGVEVGTEQVWHNAELAGLPRMLFMNKMDKEHANFRNSLEAMIDAFGKRVAPLQFPIGQEQDFRGIVDLLGGKALVFEKDGNGKYDETSIPDDLADDVAFYRQTLVEAIAEHNEDLMMRYLDGEEIGDDELHAELHKCFQDGSVVPMVLGAAVENLGVQPLMQAIIEVLPSAAERTEVGETDGEPVEIMANAESDFVALAFKTQADAHVGKVTWFRVFSGSLSSSSSVHNVNKERDERIGQLFYSFGREHINTDTVTAGDIGGREQAGLCRDRRHVDERQESHAGRHPLPGRLLLRLDPCTIAIGSRQAEPGAASDGRGGSVAEGRPRPGHRRDNHLRHGRAARPDRDRAHETPLEY